jgi:hypothetical protein
MTEEITGLSDEEREFLIWAMGYVEGAMRPRDRRAAQFAGDLAEKLKTPPGSSVTHVEKSFDVESTEEPDEDLFGRGTDFLRYVELSWVNPDGKTIFTCLFVNDMRPNRALEHAKQLHREAHPEATEVEEWLQRKISRRTADRIRRRMEAGEWQGWLAHGNLTKKDESAEKVNR